MNEITKYIRSLQQLMWGKILKIEIFRKNKNLIILIVVLLVIYISNNYHFERLLLENNKLTQEVQKLNHEKIVTQSQILMISRQSEIERRIKNSNIGLQSLTTPPKVIKID